MQTIIYILVFRTHNGEPKRL